MPNQTDDLRIRQVRPLLSPAILHEEAPLTDEAKDNVTRSRQTVADILRGADPRLLVVVGPCSIHDVDAALTYAGQPYDDIELAAGEYRLDRGLLHLRFGGGVTVYLEAPARFDAASGKRLLLRKGRLSANVPPEGAA